MGTGVVLEGAKVVTITGNNFSGLAAEAVKADAKSERILVTGNIVTDWGRVEKGAKAFDLPEGKSVSVSGNITD